MFTVAVVAASLIPTPYELVAADTDLHAPPGVPGVLEPGTRQRIAVMATMCRLGAADADACDQWFESVGSWVPELDHARRMVAKVRDCPQAWEGQWVPGAAEFSADADDMLAVAGDLRRRAAAYRDRCVWEPDREAGLTAWAFAWESEAEEWTDRARQYKWWGRKCWSHPRRVVLGEVRAAIGEAAWSRQVWP